jgi:hypothetical protein
LHVCEFTVPSRPLTDLIAKRAELSDIWTAVTEFVASHNISLEVAGSEAFRTLLQRAFTDGFEKGRVNESGNSEEAFARYCSSCKPTTLRKRIVSIAAQAQERHEGLLADLPFVALTMDAGQIAQVKLFVTNLVVSSTNYCFTHSVQTVDYLNHVTLIDLLIPILTNLDHKKIHISAIISDGASYQVKALTYLDPESLQATNAANPAFSRLLFIPCLCHRLNNAYHRLIRNSATFESMITDLRALARYCRKPAQRKKLGFVCPEFIETRWLYDYRILNFILQKADAINSLEGNSIFVTPLFIECGPLLNTLFELMTSLESSHVPLARAYPLIARAIAVMDDQCHRCHDEQVASVYQTAVESVRMYTMESTNNLMHLAYILTPDGRNEARAQLLAAIGQEQDEAVPGTPDGEGEWVMQVMRDWLELASFDSQSAPDDDVKTITADGEEDGEVISEEAGEDLSEADDDTEIPITDMVILPVHHEQHPWKEITARSREALEQIADQFDYRSAQHERLMAVFDGYVTMDEAELPLSRTMDRRRYTWLSTSALGANYAELSEIALRLEPAICSEAPSERTIGQQRRFLSSHRIRTKSDLLLARTTLEEDTRRKIT